MENPFDTLFQLLPKDIQKHFFEAEDKKKFINSILPLFDKVIEENIKELLPVSDTKILE